MTNEEERAASSSGKEAELAGRRLEATEKTHVDFPTGVSVASFAVGVVAVVVSGLTWLESRFDRLEDGASLAARESRGYIVDHIGGHGIVATNEMASEAQERDRDAVAILEGAGPEEWQLADGNAYRVEQEIDVDAWDWIAPVFPDGDRVNLDARCGIDEGGQLTVLGFSRPREAALVEYTTVARTAGPPCETGTLFFWDAEAGR